MLKIKAGHAEIIVDAPLPSAAIVRSNLAEMIDPDTPSIVADTIESFILALVAEGVITEANAGRVGNALETTLDAIDNQTDQWGY